MKHGVSRYSRGCRCDVCTDATVLRWNNYRVDKQADGFAGLTHGRWSTYNLGCKCEPCRHAGKVKNAASAKRFHEKRREALALVEALRAEGIIAS